MWPLESQCRAFYGDPTGKDGQPDPRWESLNLTTVSVPWLAVASWDATIRITKVRVHVKCANSLARVFAAIWDASGRDQKKIEEWGVHKIGGGYNYRTKRGSRGLSMHAYGCAIDLDPDRNGMGNRDPHFAKVPEVRRAFEAEGWEHGIGWSTPDAMHWQAARTS